MSEQHTRDRPWWLPPYLLIRMAVVVALISALPAVLFGLGIIGNRIELSRAEQAQMPAADIVKSAHLQLLDDSAPATPVSGELDSAHERLTASLSRLQHLASRAPGLGGHLSRLGDLEEYETRWWEFRLTGLLPALATTGGIAPATTESEGPLAWNNGAYGHEFDPATARDQILRDAEETQRDVVSAIGSARDEVRNSSKTMAWWAIVAAAAAAAAVFLRWLRRQAHRDLPQVHIVDRFSSPPLAQIQAGRRAAAWFGAAVASIILGAGVGLSLFFAVVHLKWWYWVLAIAAMIVAFAGGLPLWSRSRRRLAPNARKFLQTDGRPPVVYLREFAQDESRGEFSGLLTREEKMVRELAVVGPTLAVGRPSEQQTPIGAARLLRDEDWQTVVTSLLKMASAVVLSVGGTPGVRWELRTSVALVPPERLLLLVAPGTDLADLASALPRGLPPDAAGALADGSAERVVSFDQNWTPRLEKVTKPPNAQPYGASAAGALPAVAMALLRSDPSSIGSSPALKRLCELTGEERRRTRYPRPWVYSLVSSNAPLFLWCGLFGTGIAVEIFTS